MNTQDLEEEKAQIIQEILDYNKVILNQEEAQELKKLKERLIEINRLLRAKS